MFNYLFSSLRDLGKSTKLLEACEWSEERAQNLIIFCASAIQEITMQPDPPRSYVEMESLIKSYLLGSHTESEIDILLEIIRDDLKTNENIFLKES